MMYQDGCMREVYIVFSESISKTFFKYRVGFKKKIK